GDMRTPAFRRQQEWSSRREHAEGFIEDHTVVLAAMYLDAMIEPGQLSLDGFLPDVAGPNDFDHLRPTGNRQGRVVNGNMVGSGDVRLLEGNIFCPRDLNGCPNVKYLAKDRFEQETGDAAVERNVISGHACVHNA